MNNNDILRRIRFTFDYGDDKMIQIFDLAGVTVTRAEVCDWLKREDDEAQVSLHDKKLAAFLNGFIVEHRGPKKDAVMVHEKTLTNNIILRKLKIALNLKDDDILGLLMMANFTISKHELSAFFRKPEQRQYRLCRDQVLRNFLMGMQLKYRKNHPKPTLSDKKNT